MANKKKSSFSLGSHYKCSGFKMLVLGILIILNYMKGWFDWPVFIGGAIGILGLLKIYMPCCPECK